MRSSATPPTAGGHAAPGTLPVSKTLDFVAAMELLDNSSALYLEAVQSYFQDIANLPARLDALLRKTDLQEATRALHTCKGASLTVGANLLSDVCRQCELKLKALAQNGQALDDAARHEMQVALEIAVANTRQAIAEVLGSLGARPSGRDPSNLDARALVKDLMALRNLLARSDMRALARHKALCSLHATAAEQLQTLARPLKIFDFAQAVVQCDELIRELSAPKQP
jgi:HPt (histidine-containing phosphotransfer) domain-containing protein